MMFSNVSGCINKFQSKSNFWPVLLTIKFVCLSFFSWVMEKKECVKGEKIKLCSHLFPLDVLMRKLVHVYEGKRKKWCQ